MTLGERLAALPGVYINLDRAEEKREGFERDVAPLLGECVRLPAVDGREIPDEEAAQWHVRARVNKAGPDAYPKKWSYKTWETARGTLGCVRSHRLAMLMGLERGWDRWIVFEDDAVPRLDMLDMRWSLDEPDFVGWGGVMLAAHSTDDQIYRKGTKHRWKQLDARHDLYYGAHAYEVSPEFADGYAEILAQEKCYSDVVRAPLFGELSAWQSIPQVFTNRRGTTGSISGRSVKTGAVRRDEPEPGPEPDPSIPLF